MKSNFFSSISAKVLAWATVLTTIIAIVTAMTMLDDRYARADDVQKTQVQILKSIQLVNINLELINLKSYKQELKGQKRNVMMKLSEKPTDVTLTILLDDIRGDLDQVSERIGELKNKRVVE